MNGPLPTVGCFLLPLLLSALLTALFMRWAPRLGLIDEPSERKVHDRPVPRAGGLAIYAGFVLTAIVCSIDNRQSAIGNWQFLGLCGAIVLLGLLDDLHPLPWQLRLGVQTAVTTVVVLRWPCEAGWPLRLLALFWIVGLTNAFNMLDNMDLLAGGTAWIAAGTFVLASLLQEGSEGEWAPFLVLMGALTGFLWFNRPPARIFMGDAGSTFLGFFLGVRSLESGLVAERIGPTWLVPVAVLAVPWYDLIAVVALRLRQGRNPFHPDKQHLSHRLVARGLSPAWAVRIVHLLALGSGLAGLSCGQASDLGALLLGLGLLSCWAAVALLEFAGRRR